MSPTLLTWFTPGKYTLLAPANDRSIIAGLRRDQWPPLMSGIRTVLRPGGWIQCTEMRGSHFFSEGNRLPAGSALNEVDLSLYSLIAVLFKS
jgi:hypothetical protein